ncbi:MAG: MGH1-like glycoside hydrolase domain-containing protein, partial [Candidatus Dormibacteraceae bacterium]
FWLRTGENGGIRSNLHQFSGWIAAALYDKWLADGNRDLLTSYLDALVSDYQAWETERLTPTGLFWQRDVSDGMESSISGGCKVRNIRPSTLLSKTGQGCDVGCWNRRL